MEPAIPIFGTIGFGSRVGNRTYHEVVNPAIFLKIPTVIDRAWETGRSSYSDLQDQKIKNNLGGFVMPLRNESARAQVRLQLETPISDDASLHKLQEQVADYVREAKRRD